MKTFQKLKSFIKRRLLRNKIYRYLLRIRCIRLFLNSVAGRVFLTAWFSKGIFFYWWLFSNLRLSGLGFCKKASVIIEGLTSGLYQQIFY